jgi:hypothetical protein
LRLQRCVGFVEEGEGRERWKGREAEVSKGREAGEGKPS